MQNSIGKKITWSNKDKEWVIKISGKIEGWMTQALLSWVILWTSLGLYVMYYLSAHDLDKNEVLFFFIYLIFWAYFEWKSLYAYLFKTKGYELIKLSEDGLFVKRKVLFLEKINRYPLANIKKFEVLESDNKSFGAVYQKSFWVVGNERIGFQHLHKKAAFGFQLEDKDAASLASMLNKTLRKLN